MGVSRKGLTVDTEERVLALLSLATQQGWSVDVVSAKRSCEEQNRIFAQGRTTPGAIITHAQGCQSWHVLGRAVDLAFAKGTPTHWNELGQLGKSLGFKWGGDFQGFPDLGHFEYHPGQTIEQACPNPEECTDMDTPGNWMDPGCGQGPRVRWLPSGEIELEGEGVRRQTLPSGVLKWAQPIHDAAAKHSVPAQLIAGVMGLESGGNERADSGPAKGLMQLIPATATAMAGRSVGAQELLDKPLFNLDLGVKLMADLGRRYGGNPVKMGFSYNAGGVVCKAGCKRKENGVCVERCTPNRFNILADCVAPNTPDSFTVDYATRIIAYSNSALSLLPPPSSPPVLASMGSAGKSWLPVLAGALMGVAAGVVLLRNPKASP